MRLHKIVNVFKLLTSFNGENGLYLHFNRAVLIIFLVNLSLSLPRPAGGKVGYDGKRDSEGS